jgi:hypothetical protein
MFIRGFELVKVAFIELDLLSLIPKAVLLSQTAFGIRLSKSSSIKATFTSSKPRINMVSNTVFTTMYVFGRAIDDTYCDTWVYARANYYYLL